jgi:hypothetical protein
VLAFMTGFPNNVYTYSIFESTTHFTWQRRERILKESSWQRLNVKHSLEKHRHIRNLLVIFIIFIFMLISPTPATPI